MALTTPEKALKLLDDLIPCGEDVWVSLDAFDPPHGRTGITYAAMYGWIERDGSKPRNVRVTEKGRLRHTRWKFKDG